MFKGFFQFIKSKTFFKHLIIYVLVVTLMLWLISAFLSSVTKHGETVQVPDFKNLKIAELENFVKDKKVNFLVIDSTWSEKSKKGVVLKQEPDPGDSVKEGRKIYLWTTRIVPPKIQMPKLVDRSLRQASYMIESYQLKLGTVKYVADECANCVLDQLIKGKKIAPGQPVAKGTVISLVVGKGLSNEEVGVPCLYGLSKKEAIERLVEASLSVGIVNYEVEKDSAKSKVYKQTPGCGKNFMRRMGSTVDLFLTTDSNKIPESQLGIKEDKDEENFDE